MYTLRLQAVVILTALVGVKGLQAESTKKPTFEADVLPILNAHCLQCHGGVHQNNGLDLRTLSALFRGGKSGPAVVAGQVEDSLLWKKISNDAMPKTDNKVSIANKAIIKAWIAAGAKGIERKIDTKVTRTAMKPTDVARIIDREIAVKLATAKVTASPRADDAEFLRRVALDITGKPPTATAAIEFLADTAPNKREKLVTALLESDDYGRNFAERWINLFALTTVSERPPSTDPFIDWMAKRLNTGRSWADIIREVISADGPISETPQGLFFYYNADMNGKFEPKILAGNIGQALLGIQLQCAECHNHPFNDWKQTEFWSVAAFFGQVERMETVENNRTPGVQERHLKLRRGKPQPIPKSITISIPNDGEARNGGTKVPAGFIDGRRIEMDPAKNHRLPFAEWMTSKENRLFARAAVNRFWAHFFARGFVNPLNDFGDHNRPSHPELLDTLTDEFVASGYDLKHLVRCICLSDTYQRSSRVVDTNHKPETEPLFARMTPKVLTPEQLYDALCLALELPDLAGPPQQTKKPNPKAARPPSPRSVFIAAFRGPGEADEPMELKLGVPHALRLMNQQLFNTGGKVVVRLVAGNTSPAQVIEGLFLSALSRRPTIDEAKTFGTFVERHKLTPESYARVLWVLLNSSEFLLNH